jgi:hypothetical protein
LTRAEARRAASRAIISRPALGLAKAGAPGVRPLADQPLPLADRLELQSRKRKQVAREIKRVRTLYSA